MLRSNSGNAMDIDNSGGGEGFRWGLPPRITTRSISSSQSVSDSQEKYNQMADVIYNEVAVPILTMTMKRSTTPKSPKSPKTKKMPKMPKMPKWKARKAQEIFIQGIAVLEEAEVYVPNNGIFVRDLHNNEQHNRITEAVNALRERLETDEVEFVEFNAKTTIEFSKNITKVVGVDKRYLTKKILTTEKKEKLIKVAEFNNKARKVGARLLKRKKHAEEEELTDTDESD